MSGAGVFPTRFGPLLVEVDAAAAGDRPGIGAVVRSELLGAAEPAPVLDPAEQALLADVAAAIAAWDSGADPQALDRIPVAISGDGFRERAWRSLRAVPAGETVSYQELAELAGNGRAARAAGTACATNRLAPFVPCHRVVRGDGRVGEYGYGSDRKRAMLSHEGAPRR